MTTVLTIGGATFGFGDNIGKALGGYCTRKGHQRIEVEYSQKASRQAFREGLDALRTAVGNQVLTGQKFEILASSMGCEIVNDMLDEASDETLGQIARITFIGNTERRYGGVMGFGYGASKRRSPGRTDTPFPIDDYARVNDGWANSDAFPYDGQKPSKVRLLIGRFIDHSNYSGVTEDNRQLRTREGSTTYWMAP